MTRGILTIDDLRGPKAVLNISRDAGIGSVPYLFGAIDAEEAGQEEVAT